LDENKYRGDFSKNYRHGRGRYHWTDGEVGHNTFQGLEYSLK